MSASEEDLAYARETDKQSRKYPADLRRAFDLALHRGHKLVSQGCRLFRCVSCGETSFLAPTLGGDPGFEYPCRPGEGDS